MPKRIARRTAVRKPRGRAHDWPAKALAAAAAFSRIATKGAPRPKQPKSPRGNALAIAVRKFYLG